MKKNIDKEYVPFKSIDEKEILTPSSVKKEQRNENI